ncbi:hypothetical protein Poli38472_011764 [Pythium oligandrum]|uniref:Cyclic nucleotide-binding domain-containing protein n=1 Tax=Pythium oligandrum TaxID=41045 RepID=A0A8K1C7P0_PYTOL|nr:hypothetical protein Poli38472_011764 [Pythium oligandrum]|eukprot:TMW58176.1 hypothetical protein Poli38472_011764 [Pythium oligandrum]
MAESGCSVTDSQGDVPPMPTISTPANRLQRFEMTTSPSSPGNAKGFKRRYSDLEALQGGELRIQIPLVIPPRKSLDEAEGVGLRTSGESRRLSDPMRLNKTPSRSSLGNLPSPTDNADAKGKRYAEMMERFQIRKVVSRTPSASSMTSIRLHQNSREASDLMPFTVSKALPDAAAAPSTTTTESTSASRTTTGVNLPSIRPLPLRSDSKLFADLGGIDPQDDADQELDPDKDSFAGLPRRGGRFSCYWLVLALRRRLSRWLRERYKILFEPIAPHSAFSMVREAVMLAAFAFHLVYFPLNTAFYPVYSDANASFVLEVTVELIFVVDFVLNFNTAFYNKRGVLVTNRRDIAKQYLRGWFLSDLLSSVPIDFVVMLIGRENQRTRWLHMLYDVVFRSQRFFHVLSVVQTTWTQHLDGSERSVFAWLVYSRYSHLVRIAWIILLIILVAHYLACGLQLLTDNATGTRISAANSIQNAADLYVANFYDALQLLQGQGVETQTVEENVFAAISVLVGSIVLAIVFGHVAILVSNFNANSTSYQRKMESVFAIMSKLQLPTPLRERIHQYYEHLWREYESLDGEIVRFSKGLSHTLELEVVLCKYMELIMHIPFWADASPDFQKQLMLNLHVRVYLPDDFIIRRGEVGDEFYMINRGLCELTTGPDSFECSNDPLDDTRESCGESSSSEGSIKDENESLKAMRMHAGGPVVRPEQPRLGSYYTEAVNKSRKIGKYVTRLRRGHSFGEIALLMNYERTANVRALTYVEMCVLKRRDFQSILVRHPKDRSLVVTSVLTKTMENNEANNVRCPLRATVQTVFANDGHRAESISARHAALLISSAINVPIDDDSIKFGIGINLRSQLTSLRDMERGACASKDPVTATGAPTAESLTVPAAPVETEAATISVALEQQLRLVEDSQQGLVRLMYMMQGEIRQLRDENQQLLRMVAALTTALETNRLVQAAATATTQQSANPAPPASSPKLVRRLSRRGSDEKSPIEIQPAIPETRSIQFIRRKSVSMSSIPMSQCSEFSVRSSGRRESMDVVERSKTSTTHEAKDVVPKLVLPASTRRASFAAVRSMTMSNMFNLRERSSSHHVMPALGASNPAPPTPDSRRPSASKSLLAPLISFITSSGNTETTASPTQYADQLFQTRRRRSNGEPMLAPILDNTSQGSMISGAPFV